MCVWVGFYHYHYIMIISCLVAFRFSAGKPDQFKRTIDWPKWFPECPGGATLGSLLPVLITFWLCPRTKGQLKLRIGLCLCSLSWSNPPDTLHDSQRRGMKPTGHEWVLLSRTTTISPPLFHSQSVAQQFCSGLPDPPGTEGWSSSEP